MSLEELCIMQEEQIEKQSKVIGELLKELAQLRQVDAEEKKSEDDGK